MEGFQPAVREQIKLRAALVGPTGSGKTRGALDIATALAAKYGGKIAVIDSQNGQSLLFADRYTFDRLDLTDRTPEGFRAALRLAVQSRYTVVVVDSASHEWLAVLTDADKFGDWKALTPRHNDFVLDLTTAPLHVIATIRAKMKYQVEEVQEGGRKKQVISKLGVGPIQRENIEYEFDVLGYLDETHEAQWSNRCDPLVGQHMTPEAAAPIIVDWLEHGDAPKWKAPKTVAEALDRVGFFCDDPKPWLVEAVLVAHPEVGEFPSTFKGLPTAVQNDTLVRLVEVVRVLDDANGHDPYKDADATQLLLRQAFRAGFDADVPGPDPFRAPIPFG